MSKNQRSFRIVASSVDDGIDFEKGVYHGARTNQVALKAFNWYCRKAGLDSCKRRITIEEITRGKPHKQFHYVGTRKKLVPPSTTDTDHIHIKEVERSGNTYNVYYESNVRKAK